jgi:hypothetical protein
LLLLLLLLLQLMALLLLPKALWELQRGTGCGWHRKPLGPPTHLEARSRATVRARQAAVATLQPALLPFVK